MSRRFGLGAVLAAAVVGVTARPAAADVPGAGIIKDAGAAFSGWAWDKVTSGLAHWILEAVGSFVEGVVGFMQASTRIDLGAVWFSGAGSPYATVREVAVTLTVGFALLGIIAGTLRGDAAGMAARIGTGLPATALAMAVVVPAGQVLVQLVDALSAAVLDPSSGPGMSFLTGFGKAAATSTGGFAVVVVGLIAALAALALWAELLVRAAFVYVLVALSPVVFAATLWPAARGLLRRAGEVFVALIASKFVISVALAVGVAALGGAGQAGQQSGDGAATSVGTLLIGTAILAVGAFSPFLVLRLLPVLENATLVQGVSRGPGRFTVAAVSTATTLAAVGRLAGGAAGAAGAGAGGAGPIGGAAAATAPPAAASSPTTRAAAPPRTGPPRQQRTETGAPAPRRGSDAGTNRTSTNAGRRPRPRRADDEKGERR